jgi:O-antigen ligase
LALVYTLSRSGWLTFMGMAIVMVLSAKRQRTTLLIVLAGIAVFFTMATPQIVKERVAATFHDRGTEYRMGRRKISIDESGSARIHAWRLGFQKLAERPVLGHGIPKGSVVDNQYTRVMTETGLLGLVAFGFLLFRIFQVARSAIRQTSQNPYAQGIAIGFMAGYCALLVHGFTAATFIIIRIMEPFWFVAALVVMLPEFVTEGKDAPLVEIQGT